MVMDVVGREDRAAVLPRQPVEPLDPRIVIAAIEPARRDMRQRRQGFAKPRQFGFENVEIVARPGDERDALGIFRDIAQRQLALAFFARILPRLSSRDSRPYPSRSTG